MAIGKGDSNAGTEKIASIFKQYRTIAVVGLSEDPGRPSHQVAAYLQSHGYRIIPVNPQCQEVLGEKCYASLKDIPEPVEVVDIFRKAEAIPGIVEEAIAVGAKVIWMQLGPGAPPGGSASPGRGAAGGNEPLYEDRARQTLTPELEGACYVGN